MPPMRVWARVLLAIICVLGFAAAILGAASKAGLLGWMPMWAWIALAVGLGLVGAWFLDRSLRVAERAPPLVLERTRIRLPPRHTSDQVETVELSEVESVDLVERGPRSRLSIGTRAGLYVFPLAAFEDPAAAKEFVRAVIVGIASTPGGHEQLAQMQRRAQVNLHFARQRLRVTYTLLQLIALGFGIQHFAGALEGPLLEQQAAMVRLGANATVLVGEGQWWRLFSANFLHGGWLHIGLNGLALLSLGGVLERLLGGSRFLLVYLASGVGGTLASAWAAQGPFSVGASTAIFGLLGAFAVMSWRFGDELPTGIRQSRRWWVFILGINGALPLLIPIIDTAAHVGGFVAGALVAYLAHPSLDRFVPAVPASMGIRGAAIGLSLVYLLAGAEAGRHALGPQPPPSAVALHITPEDMPARVHNDVAWMVITAPESTDRSVLVSARDRAARAVQQAAPDAGHRSSFLDTLATAEYRLDDYPRALDLERQAILQFEVDRELRTLPGGDDGATFWSQLVRFAEAAGAPVVTGTVTAEQVKLSFEAGALLLERPRGVPMVVFAQLSTQAGPRGVVRIGVAEDTPSPASFEASEDLRSALSGQAQLHLAWVLVSAPEAVELGVDHRAHDAAVDDLP